MTPHDNNGFTMIEMVLALLLFSAVMMGALSVFAPSVYTHVTNQERTQLSLILGQQKEHINTIGFWVWDGDSDSPPANTSHPINTWKQKLTDQGASPRITMNTIFIKPSGNSLVPFDSQPFDGDQDRNMVTVTLAAYSTTGSVATDSITLFSKPALSSAWSQLYILKRALVMYAADNGGSYPATASFASALVPAYLDEIPNNPLTSLQTKSSHVEESSDWFYENASGTITLAANSHRSQVHSSWN